MTAFHWIYFVAIPVFMTLVFTWAVVTSWRSVKRARHLRAQRGLQ